MLDSKERFSKTVDNYVKYRPSYPDEAIEHLFQHCGLGPSARVADIGSGTGILTKRLLECGARIQALEPNQAMREAAESLFSDHPGFTSLGSSAEQTGLAEHSIDLITAGQAFHWFANTEAVAEFERILKPDCWVALLWNEWRTAESAFVHGFDALLHRFATDYSEVNYSIVDQSTIQRLFAPRPVLLNSFPNAQTFDWEGLQGRLKSCSYCPTEDHPNFQPLMAGLQELYTAQQTNGRITFPYQTQIFQIKMSA